MSVRKRDVLWFILFRLIVITTLFVTILVIQIATSTFLPLYVFYLVFAGEEDY